MLLDEPVALGAKSPLSLSSQAPTCNLYFSPMARVLNEVSSPPLPPCPMPQASCSQEIMQPDCQLWLPQALSPSPSPLRVVGGSGRGVHGGVRRGDEEELALSLLSSLPQSLPVAAAQSSGKGDRSFVCRRLLAF